MAQVSDCYEQTSQVASTSYQEHSFQHLQLEIEQRLCLFEEAMLLLLSIPGLQEIAAAAILAEIGAEMSCFPSSTALASPTTPV